MFLNGVDSTLSTLNMDFKDLYGKEPCNNDKHSGFILKYHLFYSVVEKANFLRLLLDLCFILIGLFLIWSHEIVLYRKMDKYLFYNGRIPILSLHSEQNVELLPTESTIKIGDHLEKNSGDIVFDDDKLNNKLLLAIPPGFSRDNSFYVSKSPYLAINSVSYIESPEDFVNIGKYCSSIEMVSTTNNPGYIYRRYMQITAYYNDNTNTTTGYIDNYYGYTMVTLNCDQNKVLQRFGVKHKILGLGSYSVYIYWGLREYIQYNWYGYIYTRPLQTVSPTLQATPKETVSKTLDMTFTPVRSYNDNLIGCTCNSNDYFRIITVFGLLFPLLVIS